MKNEETLRNIDESLLLMFSELDKRSDFPIKNIKKKLALISTPRCGSNLFCDVLFNTQQVGYPNEWISTRFIQAYANFFNINGSVSFNEYFNFVLRKTTGDNGIFSIKFHISQHQERLLQNINIFDLNFDNIYYLYRKEKMEQAYSLSKGSITDQWRSDVRAEKELPETIDKLKLLDSLNTLMKSENFYKEKISKRRKIQAEFCYEEFSLLDTTTAFHQVFSDLGISDIPTSWSLKLKKQRTEKDLKDLEDFLNYISPSRFNKKME